MSQPSEREGGESACRLDEVCAECGGLDSHREGCASEQQHSSQGAD